MIDITKSRRARLKSAEIEFKSLTSEAMKQLVKIENSHKLHVTVLTEGVYPFYNDPEYMQVVFVNLISNAIKYQHSHELHPKLEITAEVDASKAVITFKDNGIGIPASELGKVFDMFYRVPGSKSEGSGLGLYIVKDITRKLKGKIYAESAVGEGTKFIIEIPNKIDPDLVRKITRLIEKS